MLVLSLWPYLPSLSDECRHSVRWPPALRQSQPSGAASLPLSCYHPQHYLLLLLSPKGDAYFTVPHMLECWVNLDTAGRLQYSMSKTAYCNGSCNVQHCQQCDSNLTSLTLQPGILPLYHCDARCIFMSQSSWMLCVIGVSNLLTVVAWQHGSLGFEPMTIESQVKCRNQYTMEIFVEDDQVPAVRWWCTDVASSCFFTFFLYTCK